ncbi:MAG: hypothetical protein V6Z81_06590 [Parvularculales bacterium]
MPNHFQPNAACDAMLTRVAADFTYKKEMTEKQLKLFDIVKHRFDTFRKVMAEFFRYLQIELMQANLNHIEAVCNYREKCEFEYELLLRTLRSAERWFNTAIANDWETGKVGALSEELSDLLEYTGPGGGDTPVHHTCDAISKECFELTTYLVSRVPQGRSVSVAVTKMQDVRGELLDLANAAIPYFPTRGGEENEQTADHATHIEEE